MKKILTITCHNVYNHGASLQQFALLDYLSGLGHDAKTINYKPYYFANHFNYFAISNPRFEKNIFLKWAYIALKFPSRFADRKRKINFDSFESNNFKILPKKYFTNEDLKNDLPFADSYICGSDQIWNSYFENGKDPAFYLDFVPDNFNKTSYAASFAIDTIDENLKPFVKQNVERINHVSVRETSGKKILEDLGITNTTQVLDPVFLIDAATWRKRFVKKQTDEKFVFIYDFESNPFIEKIAKDIAKNNNYKIYTVNKNIKYADKNYYLEGPEMFLSLMDGAQFVITNSFHSVAFSLIFNKQFIVVNRSEAINTRMRDLLALFNLSQVLVSSNFDSSTIETINFEEANTLKKIAIDKSKAFLEMALNH
jgi:Polysaccharide pyruvyl transferase